MNCSSLVLLCVLLIGSVWMIQGKCVAVDDGPQDQDEVETTEMKLPGLCWACKWVMNKVKKEAGKNATEKTLTSKLLSVCNKIGFLKSRCQKFVKAKLQVLVEELSTTDDVRTICVNVKACKPKEAMTDDYYPKDAGETFSGRYMEEYR
uniref:Saposin B-type domain-containing protein n=2 Tax=Neogobius melanostomus TaxID=47308 RepID=A0A8C6WFC0_9GOBI